MPRAAVCRYVFAPPFTERIAGKEALSAMCAFGRRGQNGSGKYIRVYDKKLETDGQIDAVRWEVEFSGKKADKVFQELSIDNDLYGLASRISKFIGGSVDFPIRTGDHHVERLERHGLMEPYGENVLIISSFLTNDICCEFFQNSLMIITTQPGRICR